MRGYLWIENKVDRIDVILGPEGIRGLAVSLGIGVLTGSLAAFLRFHLGLPGHKALLWMTPIIAARLLDRCRVGTTAGALTAAFVSIGLGGNLAGNLVGLPLVGAAGALVDGAVAWLEKRKASVLKTIVVVAFSAMLANLICCAKRLLLPVGFSHSFFGGMDVLVRPLSYGLFGFMAGLMAATSAYLIRTFKKRR